MTPPTQIRTTYLALSKAGRIVASFETPEQGHAFIDRKQAELVNLTLVEETTVRRDCPRRVRGGSVARIADHRGAERIFGRG